MKKDNLFENGEVLDIQIQKKKKKIKLDTNLTPFAKISTKFITDLNIKYKQNFCKVTQEKTQVTFGVTMTF